MTENDTKEIPPVNPKRITRRTFLKGVAVSVGSAMLPACDEHKNIPVEMEKEVKKVVIESVSLCEKVLLEDDSSYEGMEALPVKMQVKYIYSKNEPVQYRFRVELKDQTPFPAHFLVLYGYDSYGKIKADFGSNTYPVEGKFEPSDYSAFRVVEIETKYKRNPEGRSIVGAYHPVRATPGFRNDIKRVLK